MRIQNVVAVGVRISVFGPGPGISPVVSQCCNARNFDRTAGPEPVKTFHRWVNIWGKPSPVDTIVATFNIAIIAQKINVV